MLRRTGGYFIAYGAVTLVTGVTTIPTVGHASPPVITNGGYADSSDASALKALLDSITEVGNLTGVAFAQLPASVSVINRTDIEMAPAKNLYDLLEIYAPGVYTLEHNTTPHSTFRGLVDVKSTKILFVLNGRLMNDRTYAGVLTDMALWNMDDIQKIEIIRGPGSVRYGPGAIGGVVIVTTKNAESMTGSQSVVGRVSYNSPYRSTNISLEGNYVSDAGLISAYGHASAVWTEGAHMRLYWSGANETSVDDGIFYGYLREDDTAYINGDRRNTFRPTHLGDDEAGPQLKAMVNVDLWKGKRISGNVWLRYTDEGGTLLWLRDKQLVPLVPGIPESVDQSFIYKNTSVDEKRQLTMTARGGVKISESLTFDATISEKILDYRLTRNDKPISYRRAFSDSEFLMQAIFGYNYFDRYKIAAGFEVYNSRVGPPRSDNKRFTRVGESLNILSGRGSEYYNERSTQYFLGEDPFRPWMYSAFMESYLDVDKHARFLVAGRADQHQWADGVLSAKLAYIGEFVDDQFTKAIVQRSVRYDVNEVMYVANLDGSGVSPEILDSFEIIQNLNLFGHLQANVSGFYNRTALLGIEKANGSTLGGTVTLGHLKTAGLELDAHYVDSSLTVGLSHSSLHLVDWKLGPHEAGNSLNGVSYADYDYNYNPAGIDGWGQYVNTGIGDSINNVPEHVTKFYAHYSPMGRLLLHADARINWVFQGFKDGVEGTRRAAETMGADFSAVFADYEDKGAGDMDIRLSLSARYTLVEDEAAHKAMHLLLYAQNIPVLGERSNVRHIYNSGEKYHFPSKGWFVDPFNLGIRVSMEI